MKVLLILSMITLLLGCSNLVKNGAIIEAQNELDVNNYAEALENTNIAESFGDLSEAESAKLHYLRALSLEGLDRQEEAAFSYRYVLEQHGNSAYAGLAQEKLRELNKVIQN